MKFLDLEKQAALLKTKAGGTLSLDQPSARLLPATACSFLKRRRFALTRIRGFSGCCFELIAGLKIEFGLDRVDLVGGDGRDDVNEGVDDGSMLGQIEGRELLDLVGHVPGLEQGFILQR
jgi:hypothetical protein